MDYKVMLLFLFYGPAAVKSTLWYYFVNVKQTWANAQRYCRQTHTDLATFRTTQDLNQVPRPRSYTGPAWIGLSDDPAAWRGRIGPESNSWAWSATGTANSSRYQNWASFEPNFNNGNEQCVYAYRGYWYDYPCTKTLHFVCFTGPVEAGGLKNFTLVRQSLSWWDAQTYCRTHYTDLAVIEEEVENSEVQSQSLNLTAWIGLSRTPWRWSDDSNNGFKNWIRGEPNNVQRNQHCVMENSNHDWLDEFCDYKYPFICYDEQKTLTILKMRLQTEADLSDPTNASHILKQLKALIKSNGDAEFKLKWIQQPRRI